MTGAQQVLLHKLRHFTGVGALGFLVDAFVFFTAVHLIGVHFAVARIAASLVALTVTWLLNRSLTFKEGRVDKAPVEFLRYLSASGVGALSNLAVVALIAPYDAAFRHVPAYVAGAALGLVVNFLLYDRFVFRGRPTASAETQAEEKKT